MNFREREKCQSRNRKRIKDDESLIKEMKAYMEAWREYLKETEK